MKAWIIAAIVLLIAIAGWRYLSRDQPIVVATHVVSSGLVRSVVANTRVGTVKACDRAKMSPASSGSVARLNVASGDRVDKDQILLEIWNEDLKAEIRLAEAEITAASARADEACATSAGAEREANRLKRLRDRKLIAEETVDEAVTLAETKLAGCRAAIATTRIQSSKRNVALENLERTMLRAPFGGVVAEVEAKLGEFLTPSPPGIATLPAIDLIGSKCIYVSAPIDEVDAPQIAHEMPVCVTLDAFSGKRCNAHVRRIANYVKEVEKQARTVEVEVAFADEAETSQLLPGYSADIEILVEQRENVLRVPSEAILEGNHVLVLDPTSNKLSNRKVKTGLADWEFTEILEGLKAGEEIVISTGRSGVKDGAAVQRENEG